MKLWEIKAQALRLMFTDTDIQFSQTEFSDLSVYSNANTREKLIRMEDSIRRAIDMYYMYVGAQTSFVDLSLKSTVDGETTTYENVLELSSVTNLGYPSRIDVSYYSINDEDEQTLIKEKKNVNFIYDQPSNEIFFNDEDYKVYYEDYDDYVLVFKLWYKVKLSNLPTGQNEITYDLTTSLGIPEEVCRHIPYFIKGELYEEDEAGLAQAARNTYVQFLMALKKPFSQSSTKVKNPYRRGLL